MKKAIYIFISLIISALIFLSIQTNRVYIKARIKQDCVVKLTYKDYNNKEFTTYAQALKYPDSDVEKIKLRLKANVKSMNIYVENDNLDVESVNILSGVLPYKLKSITIPDNTFKKIFAIRVCFSLLLGFFTAFLFYYFIKLIYHKKEKFMIGTFLFVFVLPLFLTLFPIEKLDFFTIHGDRQTYTIPKFSIKSFVDKSFQQQFEGWFNQKLVWNGIYIKFFNSLYYTVFDKSYSSNSELIIGKNKYLYEKAYIDALYFPNRFGSKKDQPTVQDVTNRIENNVSDLQQIQKYFEKHGKTFIFVLTPSKSDFEEKNIPDRFSYKHATYQQFMHNTLIKELKQYDINFVNIPDELKKNKNGHPSFNKNGIHWNDYSKIIGSQAIIDEINKKSKYKYKDINVKYFYKNDFPLNEDVDLMSLLNILKYPKMNVEQAIVYPNDNKDSDVLVNVVGGSFANGFCEMLMASHTFKTLNYYFYIHVKLIPYKNYLRYEPIDNDSIKDDFKNIKEVTKGDIIILELNDAIIAQQDGHINSFINNMKKIMSEGEK